MSYVQYKMERINEIIEEQEEELTSLKEELETIKRKWIKFSVHFKLIEFLEYYIKLKEKEIQKIKLKADLLYNSK